MITLQQISTTRTPLGHCVLADLCMHRHTPFSEIAAKHETIIFVAGHDMVRRDPPRLPPTISRPRS